MATTYIPKIVYNAITITFDYPTVGPDALGQTMKATNNTVVSQSGLQQTLYHFTESVHTFTFSHVSSTLKDSIETFLIDWGFRGKEFDYYPDKDDAATKITVRLTGGSKSVQKKIITWTGSGTTNAVYEFKMQFRRILT